MTSQAGWELVMGDEQVEGIALAIGLRGPLGSVLLGSEYRSVAGNRWQVIAVLADRDGFGRVLVKLLNGRGAGETFWWAAESMFAGMVG